MRSAATLCSLLLAAPLTLAFAAPAQASPLTPADSDLTFPLFLRSSTTTTTTTTTTTAAAALPASLPVSAPAGNERDRRIGFRGVRGSSASGSMTAGPVAVPSDVAVIGVTWDEGTGQGARLAYRVERDGTWGPWQQADVELCSDCADPGTVERAGSEPIVVTGAQRVEVRLSAVRAGRPRLTIIDPDSTTSTPVVDAPFLASTLPVGTVAGHGYGAAAARTAGSRSERAAAPAGLAGPRISMPVKRSAWRAAKGRRPDVLGTPRGVVVHHTAGTNSYSKDQVPGILRGIQRFHIQDRGWSDIGYNALVDRFGGVWEGRPGGVGDPHRGAHARGVNETYLGVAYLGDTNTRRATKAGVDAMTDLIAWSAARYGFDPEGTLRVRGRTTPVVVGHSRVGNTSCPGKDLTRRLPAIRRTSARLAENYLAEGRARAEAASRG